MSRRLLVITEELPSELHAAGADAATKAAYYNPAGFFDDVALIDWGRGGDWPGMPHRLLHLPRVPALEAWLVAVQSADFNTVMGDEIGHGWPGVPAEWLKEIKEFGPTCIRAYGVRWSGWLAQELAGQLNVPVLCSIHNVIGYSSAVLKRGRLLMAVSDEVAARAIAAGADPAAVVTVPNRVHRALFSPEGETAPGPDGSPKLLCVARDVAQKNLDRLLKACEAARKQNSGLILVHIGHSGRDWREWPFATHIEAVPNAELPRWYRWADAFILPSLFEGFGTCIIESLACGLPVVTSNRAPMSELVTERWDGLLCDPESAADIARAIAEVAEPATRARLAAPARAASETYDSAAIDAREAALYSWLTSVERPKVSVVMPTFNRASMLRTAVRNTLEQGYANLELIVVNDGSTDESATVLAEFAGDSRLRVIEQKNEGLSRAINTGMKQSSGKLMMWKGDDDLFKPGALEALARELALDPPSGVMFADYELVGAGAPARVVRTGPLHEMAERNVVGLCFLIRRDAWTQSGGVNPEYHLAEDYELWVRLSRITKLRRLARVLYTVTDHTGTLTNTKVAEVQEATMRVQQQHYGAPEPAAYAEQLARLAGAYKAQGMPFKSLRTALKLLHLKPKAGCWAGLRALTPGPVLRLTRRLRGLKS
ncbi:MAG: glycosyltransferase [Planctomycetes bacterium]|nr:glycosyltransferase [Planctomycetota bacterium]MCW8136791.1 glycosyltransferase [Planctomycetota bacterium]